MARSTRGKRSPRPSPRPSIVVTFAASATLLACGGQVDGNQAGNDGGADSNPAGCPTAAPSYGSTCEGSLSCDYPGCDPSIIITFECESGSWKQTRVGSCNPPGFVCPPTEPALGTSCASGSSCAYPDSCTDRPTSTSADGSNHYECDYATSTWKLAVDYVAHCPDAAPADGASCACGVHPYPLTCTYATGCAYGVGDAIANCDTTSGTWRVVHATCNPPGPDGGPIDVGVYDAGSGEASSGDAGDPP